MERQLHRAIFFYKATHKKCHEKASVHDVLGTMRCLKIHISGSKITGFAGTFYFEQPVKSVILRRKVMR